MNIICIFNMGKCTKEKFKEVNTLLDFPKLKCYQNN